MNGLELAAGLVSTIDRYFAGERLEMIAILAGGVVFSVAAGVLWFHSRDAFATGLLAVVALSSLLLCGTAAALLVRDGPARASLIQQVRDGGAAPVAAAESARITVVIGKYPLYRTAALLLGLAGLFCAWWRPGGALSGVATGLLLLAAAQSVIDHCSEQRARSYLASLTSPPLTMTPEPRVLP